MHWIAEPGTSLPEERRMVTARQQGAARQSRRAQLRLAHRPGGRWPTRSSGANFTELWISIDPKADYDKTMAAVQTVVDGYPGLYRDVLTYLSERIKEVLTGASEPIVVRVFGADLRRPATKARRRSSRRSRASTASTS